MRYLCVLAVLIGMGFVLGAGKPDGRKSADGLDLPPAALERKFRTCLPIAGPILGQRPEEVGRVFNTDKSATLLAKQTDQKLGCDWFVVHGAGADVAGLGLTDGRVSKLVLYFQAASSLRLAGLHHQLDSQKDQSVKVTFQPVGDTKKPSLLLTFEVNPIEFYIISHGVDSKIADALRQHVWIPEMNDEQATMVGDGPGKYLAIFAPDAKSDVGAGTVFAEGAADIRLVIEARNKQQAREIALTKHKTLKDIKKVDSKDAR